MVFYKTSETAKEELRLAELGRLYSEGKLSTAQYLAAINQLKEIGEGGRGTDVMGTAQLLLIVVLAGMGVYLVHKYA